MRRALLTVIAAVLALATSALAGGHPPQKIPEAPLRVDGTKQGGRLVEAAVDYRVGADLCVSQGTLGDGKFPRPRRVTPDSVERLRFRLNAERRPQVSLRFWTEVDSEGFAEGDSTPVPIEVTGRKANGDFILDATLDTTGKRYLRLFSSWEGKGFCGGQELLINHYALAPNVER